MAQRIAGGSVRVWRSSRIISRWSTLLSMLVWLVLGFAPNALAQGNCPNANPNDWVPDDIALQACLDAGGTIILDPGSPGYVIQSGLVLRVPGTIITSSQAPNARAVIVADNLLNDKILQTIGFVDGFKIEYISFDGRVDCDAAGCRAHRDECQDGAAPGNLSLAGNGLKILNSESKRAMCGSGLELSGTGYIVDNNYIAYNGRDRFSGGGGAPWSDGMTVISCYSGHITNNTFVDNTDIDLVVGGGTGCDVSGNTIWHGGKYAFAGLDIGNFDNNGNHAGSIFQNNTITSVVADKLSIGLLVGTHPWHSNLWVHEAGSVINNTISGAVINLVVEGIDGGGNVTGNLVSGHQGSVGKGSCSVSADYTVYLPHAGHATLQLSWDFQLKYDDDSCEFPLIVPTVATGAATGITMTGAVLNGTANPNGYDTTASFQYGTTTNYGSTTPMQAMGSGTGALAIGGGALTGLSCGTAYHFRAVATNVNGTTNGSDQTFTTAVCPPPTVLTGVATGITMTGATLNGTANPNGYNTTASFQYGTTTNYGNATPTQAMGSGTATLAIGGGTLTGLTCSTVYHFRAVATNVNGTTNGSDQTFTTAACPPPTVLTGVATGITMTGATLNGTVNPNGLPTTANFQHGLTTNYGNTTGSQAMGSGTAALAIGGGAITGLTCSTVYHFRAVATSSRGTTNGSDATFTTAACPAPTVVTGAATGITLTGATLNGTANPNGLATTASFQYGLTTGYGSTTSAQAMGSGTGALAIGGGAITGMTCSTLYHFRAVATNSSGTTNGLDGTFTTTTCPPPTVVTGVATINKTSATLNGTANPNGLATTASFQYGLTTGYGSTTSGQAMGSGTGAVAIGGGAITGLICKTLYHFSAVATNGSGTTTGLDATFTTNPCTQGDLDGDGKADLVVRNGVTGQYVGWLMNGLTISNSAFLATVADLNWEVKGVGDLDGDGKADIVLRNKVTGGYVGWLMNGLTITSSGFLATVADTNWEMVGMGDLDGDGKADIVLRNKVTGGYVGWLMNGLTISNSAFLATVADLNWEVKGVGDLDGDGKADIVLRNKVTGGYVGWLLNGLTIVNSGFLATVPDLNWEMFGLGDLDGDGKADVIIRNKVTGGYVGWLMNGLTITNSAYLATVPDLNWELRSVEDLNGDGKADIVVRNKVTGGYVGWLMNGLTITNSAYLATVADTNWDIVSQGH